MIYCLRPKILFPIISIIVLFISCDEENDPQPEDNTQRITEIRNLLESKNNENILIEEVNILNTPPSYEIIYEDSSTITIEDGVISDITLDTGAWEATVTFSDGTQYTGDYLGNSFEIQSQNIVLDPFENTPLSASANFTTPVSGKIKIIVKGQDGDKSNIQHTFSNVGTDHSIAILGLYADYLNEIDIVFMDKDNRERVRQTVEIQTAPLPDGIPEVDIVKAYDSPVQNQMFLVNYRPSHIPFMVDAFGKVRWYSVGFTQTLKRSLQRYANGNMGFGAEDENLIYEFTMLGEKLNEWTVLPDFEDIHHEVFELPNGNFVVSVNKVGFPTVEDFIIEINRNSGNIDRIWDLNEVLPKRTTFFDDPEDWVHVNAIIYDESDNTLIVSGQRQGIFKITQENELKWILAPREGWEEFLPFVLSPLEGAEPFENIWGQHAPLILPNGNILLFDNGFGREYGQGARYSRIVEFNIQEDSIGGTVEQIWSYGKERGEELYSPIISDVDYLPETQTRLMIAGSLAFEHSYVDSTTINNGWGTESIKARIIEVNQNEEVLFELTISSDVNNGSVYRAEKMEIYPEEMN